MICTDNAPALERKLHDTVGVRRMNKVNDRKEFFRVTVDEIERAVAGMAVSLPNGERREVQFKRTALAEQWRQSVAMEEERQRASGVVSAA